MSENDTTTEIWGKVFNVLPKSVKMLMKIGAIGATINLVIKCVTVK